MSNFFKLLDTEQYGQVLVLRGDTNADYFQYVKIIAEPSGAQRIDMHPPVCCPKHQATVYDEMTAGGVSKIIEHVLLAHERAAVAEAQQEKQHATEH